MPGDMAVLTTTRLAIGLSSLAETADLSLIEIRARVSVLCDDDVATSDAEEAIVAADVVARLMGTFTSKDSYTKTADDWVMKHRLSASPILIKKAVAALDRILTKPSELLELWEESDTETDAWKRSVKALRSRLSG